MRTVPFQHPWSVNCWCGIVVDHVNGPYFFEVRMNMWMQHDGAPTHYALCSRQVMDEMFDEKWIGRGGPIAWPPCSPDLTSAD